MGPVTFWTHLYLSQIYLWTLKKVTNSFALGPVNVLGRLSHPKHLGQIVALQHLLLLLTFQNLPNNCFWDTSCEQWRQKTKKKITTWSVTYRTAFYFTYYRYWIPKTPFKLAYSPQDGRIFGRIFPPLG